MHGAFYLIRSELLRIRESFDVYIGNVKRAPRWWIEHNLEGAYRLINQPFKIKRFIKALPFWWNLYLNRY